MSQIAETLKHRMFRWWFISQVLSASGAMTQTVALSWLVLEQTHSALWLGMITVCAWAPLLLLGPWVGAAIDTVDRRRLLITTQSLFVVVSVALSLLTLSRPPLAGLFALAATSGVITAFDGPARQVYVADIVGRERIAAAVSLYEVTMNASRVLGPALGGALLGTVGAWACFLANAFAFLPPLGVLLANPPGVGTIVRLRREPGAVRKGLAYVARSPQIRACLPIAAASGMLFNLGVALPVFASRALHLGAGGYGALMASFGMGALPGAILAAGTNPTGRQVRVLALATAVLVLILAGSPVAAVAFVALAFAGFAGIWFITAANTLVQILSSAAVRGRVMAAWSMALPGSFPITGVLMSASIQAAGPRAGLALAGVALALTTAMGWVQLGREPAPDFDPPPVAEGQMACSETG